MNYLRINALTGRPLSGHLLVLFLLTVVFGGLACAAQATGDNSKASIVVTYPILGSVVNDLIGDRANVAVPMPNGQDPHEWEPSARDIATLNKADLVVQNGLGLEGGMEKTLEQARKAGVKFFTASDHITVRKVGPGEGIPSGDPDQAVGADDSHIWTDPMVMKAVAVALADQLRTDLGIDVSDRLPDLVKRLDALDEEVAAAVAAIPPAKRKLVTGHESMGYFAQRYGFKLVGAIIPSQTSQAEASAADLAELKKLIRENEVAVVFTELGTSPAVAQAIGRESRAKVVELSTHTLDKDGSYFTFMRNLVRVIVDSLK